MELKYGTVAYLIYGAMACYLAGSALLLVRQIVGWLSSDDSDGRGEPDRSAAGFGWIGWVLFGIGFHLCLIGWIVRWEESGHAPLQSMFEVFLTLGMLMFPLSILCRKFLGVGVEALDALLGFLILFPAGFISKFSMEPQHLPPALQSPLFIPHVSAYMLSYAIMFKAFVQAVATLIWPRKPGAAPRVDYETGTYRMASLGFPLLTLGLVLGAWWGKLAWGDYWNWDPKELWSLVSWLIFVGYLHFRHMFGKKRPRVNATMVVSGFVAILLTLLWVNLAPLFSGGMHSYAS